MNRGPDYFHFGARGILRRILSAWGEIVLLAMFVMAVFELQTIISVVGRGASARATAASAAIAGLRMLTVTGLMGGMFGSHTTVIAGAM